MKGPLRSLSYESAGEWNALKDSQENASQEMKEPKLMDEYKTHKREQSKKSKRLYDQTIFRDWCKACGICSAFCPQKVLGHDESGGPVIERPDDCIGCRFCEFHCPDFAITITERNT